MISFVISIRDSKTRFSVPSTAGAAWLPLTVSMYQNNLHDRTLPVTHANDKTRQDKTRQAQFRMKPGWSSNVNHLRGCP
jgi:hypothetical protein